MSLIQLFSLVSNYLIEVMAGILFLALLLRYCAYRNGKVNLTYFRALASSVEKRLGKDDSKEGRGDVETWIKGVLAQVEEDMPTRGVRFQHKTVLERSFASDTQRGNVRDFLAAKHNVIYQMTQQADALRNPAPPNYAELSERVLGYDPYWTRLFGLVPLDTLQRFLGILPGLFIIGGIFGTFIGIAGALPTIATIDLQHIEKASPIINSFVAHIAFSMNTSIAGIFFSVVLTLLNTLFPLASVRQQVKSSMVRTFESLWHELHNEHMSHGEREIVKLLQELVQANSKHAA